MIGSSIGPYLIVERIGAGGMGEVFLARDTRLNRRVALKILADPALDNPEARDRLLHEARAAARLAHPNIAAVHDVLDCDSGPCIVMEYVQGETLEARLRRGPLDCVEAVLVGAQLADALAHAHAAGVVHRDLKPANVVLTANGSVKVLDFGVARIREQPGTTDAELTVADLTGSRSGKVSGTPAYMAPEQLLGGAATPLTDVYTLGVLVFELVSGRRPFDGADFMALGLAVLTDPTPRLDRDGTIPTKVADIVARAMARQPTDRYQSAAELAAALREVAQSLDRDGLGIWVGRASSDLADREPRASAGPSSAARVDRQVGARPGRSDAAGTERARESRRWSRRRIVGVGGGTFAAVVLALWTTAGTWLPARRPATPIASGPPIVAVLPLSNFSGDASRDYLGVGVSEALITALAGQPGVAVVSGNETARYLGRVEDRAKIARDLGVTMLVDGGVQQVGDWLRFTVKLMRADRRVVWAGTYEGAMSDLFRLQARAAADVGSALRVSPRTDVERVSLTPAANLDAYADYSMGRALLAREDVAGNAEKAVAAFERAVAKDGRFASAYAGLGEACWWRYQETNDAAWVSRAIDAIRHALALDRRDERIRVSLATVLAGTGKTEEAIGELRAAIASRPNDDEAHRLLANALAAEGQNAEALREYEKAIAVRPNYFRNYSALGGFHFRAGRYAEAARAYLHVTEVQPDSTWGFINLGAAYLAAGDTARALDNFQRSLTLGPEAEAYSNIGTIYYVEQRFQDAVAAYQQAIALAPRNAISHNNLGDALRRLGEAAKARAEYQAAADLTGDRLKVNPRDAKTLADHALYLAKAGRHTQALADARRAVAANPDDAEVLYETAVVHAQCRELDQARAWLDRAFEKGYSRKLADEDDDLAPLRAAPRRQAAADNRGR